ncbi:MAG: hypothetical protein WC712_05025 [Candidatus Brocadiia bacterium]
MLQASWDSIVSHSTRVKAIRTALRRDELPHSMMMLGPRGIGKRRIALCAASSLLCKVSKPGSFCGECHDCRRIWAGTHPDVISVRRRLATDSVSKKSDGEGKESRFIAIGDEDEPISNLLHTVRGMCEVASLKPFEADRKVFIVDEAERMTHEAQDALLKTLEQPHEDTYIILLCRGRHAVKETIFSRCSVLQFHPLSEADVATVISREVPHANPDDVRLASFFADGSPGRAIELLDENLRDEIRAFFEWFTALPLSSPLAHAESLIARPEHEFGPRNFEPIRVRLELYFRMLISIVNAPDRCPCADVANGWAISLPQTARAEIAAAALEAIADLARNVRAQFVLDYLTTRILSYVPKPGRK